MTFPKLYFFRKHLRNSPRIFKYLDHVSNNGVFFLICCILAKFVNIISFLGKDSGRKCVVFVSLRIKDHVTTAVMLCKKSCKSAMVYKNSMRIHMECECQRILYQ